MGYQDFLQNYKQKRQQEPIELPEYDPLPTQVNPVEQIFGKPRPADKTVQAETNTSAPLEKPKKKKDILDTKLPEGVPFETLRDVKDWTPNKPIQDLKQLGSALKVRRQLHQPQLPQKKRTVAAKPAAGKAIPYTPQTGKNNDQSEFLNQMDFRGPNEAEKAFSNVRESMGLQPSVPESRRKSFLDKFQQEEAQRSYQKNQGILADIEANSAQAAAERRISQPQNTIQTARGADLSKSSLSAVTGQKEREAKTRLRRNRVDDIRGLAGGSTNTTNRMVGRALALVSGYAPDEIAEAIPPTGSLENAAAHLTGAAIRGATSIPEGVARFLEQNLVNRDAVQTYELMSQFADAEDKRAASEGRVSRGDEYRKIAQGSLESQTHVGDYLEPLTKAGEKFSQSVLPTDPTVEGSINPLKRGFWENTLPEAAGSMAPFFAGGAAGAAVKIPRMLSAGVLGAGMEIPQGYHEARDAGATPEQLSKTIDTRTAAGALEMFGAESLLGKIGMKGKSIPGYLAKESFQEGVQEAGQSGVSDVGDKYYAKTKPNLAWSQIGHNALENAVPALFLGFGGGAMGVPAHLAERKANSAEVAQQIESLANAEPNHPVVQAIASLGIDPQTITRADEKAVDELSIRLQAMAKMDSQIQQMQGQREVLAQQAQNVYDAQLMGRVPSSVDMQAAQQLPMVDQAVAELTQQKEAVTEDLAQNVSPLFRNLAKAVGNKQVEPLADVADDQQGDLLKEVRKAGGIIATEGQVEAGELEGLSPKESGTTGLISRSTERGELPDRMRERMASEGLTTAETANQFIDEVKATTRRQQTEAESYADYQRSQMTEQELADSDLLDQHLADRTTTFSRVWRTLDNPKTIFTQNLARDFVREAEKAGFSDEFIERSLVEFEAQRGVRRSGSESEESRGLRTDSSIDTGASQSSMVDSERSINSLGRSAEPGIGVSMSPYKVLETNNKDLLKRLYEINLNSEEGKAGIAQLRDYARKNGIEQRHVNAHISDIQNWQAKYGVPKLDQPGKVQPAVKQPETGFSLDQKKLLGREPAELADDEFDEYLEAVEKLHADAVHGKVNLNEGQMNAVVKKIRQIKGERHQRVRAGRLKSLYGKKEGKYPSKAEMATAVEKAVSKQKTVDGLHEQLLNAPDVETLIRLMGENSDYLEQLEPRKRTWLVEAAEIRGQELTKNEKKSKSKRKTGSVPRETENVPQAETIEKALESGAPANWQGDEARERAVKNLLYPLLDKDRAKTESVFDGLKRGLSVSEALGEKQEGKSNVSTKFPLDKSTESIFDEILGELTETESEKKSKPSSKSKAEKSSNSKRKNYQIVSPAASGTAKSAATEAILGMEDIAKGLRALLIDPNRLGSGLVFDEQTYAKAKPYFNAAMTHFESASNDVREVMRRLLTELKEKHGFTVEMLQQLKPMIVRFVDDYVASAETKAAIDNAAHEAATSPKNDLAEPTEAQKEAGNYQKGHVNLHGLDITVENPEGSVRSGKDADGKPWEVEMSAHYGYIRRTEGADEEQIDVYIGSKVDSNEVFVVDQVDAETGEFDEHKVILGAETQAEAEKLYDAHFDDGKGSDRRGAITQMPVDEFKEWLKSEDTALPVSESLGEVDDIGRTEPSGEKAEKDGDAEVGQSPDGGLQTGSGGDVLKPVRRKNSVERIMGDIHSLEDVQRVGEVDFELWENEGKGGKTTIIRDAETGEPVGVRYDPDGARATKRHQNDVQTARKREVSSDERSVDDGRLPESGLADQSGRSEPATAKSEGQPERGAKPGSVVGTPAKSGKRRGLGKQTTPSLFGDENEQGTESSNSEHAQELVAEVAQETEPIAASEAVIQAAVADLPEVAEEVQPEEPQPKPVTKPKAQPLATLTSASFTITPDIVDQIRSGGAVTKYKQNVDAIKTMRQVLLEGRRPTVEEQETMALYAGFGGIKDLFAATGNTYQERQKWFDRQNELKELIGEEAYKAASASTKNAHYTDPHIVTAMWSMAERLGFTKGRVLEPSMGSGNFLGLIPSHLRDKTTFTGVELDNTTGNIAKMLYPDANIHIQGFEDLKAPDGFFDLAIGNVPFGDYRISDNRYNKLLPQIHNYFFLKALDKVRPGGLVMFITSTGTMDSRRGEDIRKELAKQADLVSAMRFPAETFGKTALTSVVTDLIILRKRLPGETSKNDAWVKSSEVNDPRGAGYQKIKLNNYFAENPSQMLGEFNGNNRMYPGRANVDRTEDFEQRLAEAMADLPQGVMSEYSTVRQPQMKEAGMKAKEGGYIVKDGQLLQNVSGGLAEIDATPDRIKRVDGMLKIRDAFDNLIDAEMGRAIGGPAQRKVLNSAYDAFHAKYGPISDKKNREALEGDPDLYRLMALEDYDAKKKIAKKQPIFTKPTVSGIRADAKPSTLVEAVAKSFQMKGEIVLSQLAKDLGLDERTIGEELVAKKIAFQTPNGNWELAPHYLSGNVRRKLAEAKIAAATDDFFQANVDALEQLLPRDIRSDEISVEIGAPWMEPQVISHFVAELFEDDPNNVGVSYDRHLGAFTLSLDRSRAKTSRQAITTWGTPDLPFDKLLNLALTNKQASVFDEIRTDRGTERRFNAEKTQAANTKLDAIKQRFREWVWENDERKQKLLSRYNDLFNSHVPAEYNVEFLLDEKGEGVVPGLSFGWKLRKHQAAAVFRAVIEKRGLLAHEVGLGKTLAMIASASELKRLGIARKPAIAVPKKVLPGFVSAARSAFPLMKIHVVDSRDAAKRNTSMSQVATGEHDLVLMTHDNMDMLKMRPEFEAEILRSELDEVTAVYNAMRGEKTSDKRLLKQIENRKSKLEAKLQDALKAERKDDTISFEDTGIDFLFVDEFHKYKSLPVVTALGQVKGVPTGDSQRAINMLMRARYLQQIQNGGGLIAATGTPVSNSLVEAWIMAKFLQPDLLEEAGVQSFDAWTRQFAETVPALEMGATGEWKQVSRLSKFKNLPELQTLARMTLDVKTAKETGILDVRPKRQDKVIQVPQDEAQAAFMQVLRERAAAVKSKLVEPYEDNYLVISSDGMQMASDPRLVLPGYKAEGGKIKALADNVLRIYKEKPGTTQMIFSDSGVAPNAWGFHLYGEIINKLIEGGIPADKIINFSKMDTDAKVAKAQDRLNSADAVIAIGHRENMGTGINAQQKMAAIHQFDVPWKPALVEQSEARGWRQGNENKEIEILSYVTEGSFDAIKWSTVARKQQAITAFMQKPQEGQARELEDADDDALSYDQIAAAASGDGDYLRKAELDAKVFKLDMMERSHNSEALNRKQEIPRIIDRIAALNRRATQMDLVAVSAKEVKEKEFEYKTPKGEVVEDKKDAAKNLVSNYLFEKDRKERSVIGQYKGYRLMSDGYGSAYMELPIKGAEAEKVSFNVNTTEFIGTLQSLEKKVSALASNADADHLREVTIPNLEKDLENLRAVTDSPFPFTEQLTKAKRQLEAVNKRLKAKEAESVSEGQPLSAGDTDVRAVSALGRKIRRHLREKEIKPSDIPRILEKALPEIEAQLRDQKDVWREFQRRKAEEFLAEHEGDTGLAGMAITAQSASRAQAAYDPELDATARAGKNPIGSNYWGTPRVQYDADGRAMDEASIIPNARAEFRPGGKDRSGMFWSNEQGAIVLGSAAELAGVKIGTVSGGFSGLAMSLPAARKALSALKSVAKEYGPEISTIATEFEKAVVDARKTGQSAVVIVDISSQPTLQEAKATAREERFHRWQRNFGLMESENARTLEAALRDDPVYQNLRDHLLNVDKYIDNPSLLITEASAKIASGQWERYGLETEQQGLNFLHRYMRLAVRLFGINMLRGQVPGTPAARGVYQDVNDIEGPEAGFTGGSSANQRSERGNSGVGRDDSGLQRRQQSFGRGSQDGSGLPETAAAARHQFKPGQSSGKNIYDVTVDVYDWKAGKNRSKVVKVTADSRPEAMRRAEEQVSRSYPTIKAGGTAINRNVQGYTVRAWEAKKDFEGQRYKDAVNDRRAIQQLSQQAIEAINKIAFAEAEAELQQAYREVLNELGQDSEIAETLLETYRAMHKPRPGANVVNILNANEDAVSYLEGKIGNALRMIPEKQHADTSASLSTSRREVAGPASDLANPMDVLLNAETITKSRGSRGVRMYVNDHARALLGASLTEVFDEDYSNVNAINLSREEVSKVADYLEGEAKELTGDYQAGAVQFVQELRDMLAQAKPDQRTFNIVDITPFEQRYSTGFRPDAERAVETFKGDVREESFHWSQREVGGTAIASVGSSWAQSSKGYGKYRKALLKLGYPDDPEVIAAETAAKIAAGKFEDLGIRTEADHQQADEWLASYFERIADKHGVDALTKFDRLLPKATEAKQKGELSAKERLRQAIKEEAATATGQRTDRPKPSGGSGQTVRGGNQEGRQEGRAESIPRRSADEPFESSQPVKGPQLPITEGTNVENVRLAGEAAPEFDNQPLKRAAQQKRLLPDDQVEFAENRPFENDPIQASLFDEKGMPRKEWGDIWKTLADILNLPKALRASGDLSAGGRQGWFLSIPPTRWHIAAKSFGKSLQASEGFGLKKGADKRLHAEMKQRPAYRDAVAAGLAVHSNDPLSVQTELFGSRLAGQIPWAKYSEQAYKTHLDWLSLMTFEVYKKSIDKQIKDPKERFEAYQAAADWINVSSGRGSYRGKFGVWYQQKAAPMLNIFGWAPGLVYSRFQLLNPYTYAQNLKNPGHRVVFRKQMGEVFQSAAVLYVTATLAKAGGALISTDPDDADFLKLRFGTTRYDVLAGLQQVARLALRIGDYLRIKATTDTSTEEGQKKVRKASAEATTTLLRFGRTKLGPVPAFVVDWWNDWVKVTGERHAPGEFITSFKEGNKVKGFADLAEDPIASQVLPLFWADMVAAYEQGWRANGNQGGLEHAAKMLPAGLGIGVQDYDRPEWNKETRKQLDKFDLDPQFPKRKTGEKEEAYQKRVKEHIADQEAAINRFSSSESVKDQPLTRQKELLKQEMSEDGRNRLEKLRPDDIEDDRAVRAWILLGVDRLKNDPSFKTLTEEGQKKALQSYYSRMNPYKAQPANKVHGYQKPDFVDEDVLKRKIREAIKAQQ